MVLSLIGCGSKESTDDASAQEEKQNKAKIEEAMENEDYDKAKTLTANDSNYKDLYKDLEAYLLVEKKKKLDMCMQNLMILKIQSLRNVRRN